MHKVKEWLLYHLLGSRLKAILIKEFIQLTRDKVAITMIMMLPLIQLALFGYAINMNPHSLPTAVVVGEESVFSREFIRGLQNTAYFDIKYQMLSIEEADKLMEKNDALFIISIPFNFSKELIRGQRPQILIEADATEPVAIANAVAAGQALIPHVYQEMTKRSLPDLQYIPPPIDLVLHQKYNPENITQYNIVPGLMGVILTMTMVMVTALAITRERERGTIESLLAAPVHPWEVMIGKILPYIAIGYIQLFVILFAAHYLFHIPMMGSLWLLLISSLPFILSNLVVGIMFSSISKSQLQAMQMTFYFFLPSLLLSGFMFPFSGMPLWARVIGEILPLTHYVRIVRGIMLKGNSWEIVMPELGAIVLFGITMLSIAVLRYRQTID
ncbi:MAG: export transporter permease protein [Gammaproteobacteria bacterium]|nr:export transporter permease protein [Gammaproteobacteria bacterium]